MGGDPLIELERFIRKRLDEGAQWDQNLFDSIVDHEAFEVAFWAVLGGRIQKIRWMDSSLSRNEWFRLVQAFVWEELDGVDFSKVRDFPKYFRTFLKNCLRHAMESLMQGTGTKSGTVSIKPSDVKTRTLEISDEDMKRIEASDLEDCVLSVIETLPERAQIVFKLLFIYDMNAAKVAVEIGRSESAISQMRKKYFPKLQAKVKEQCLGGQHERE